MVCYHLRNTKNPFGTIHRVNPRCIIFARTTYSMCLVINCLYHVIDSYIYVVNVRRLIHYILGLLVIVLGQQPFGMCNIGIRCNARPILLHLPALLVCFTLFFDKNVLNSILDSPIRNRLLAVFSLIRLQVKFTQAAFCDV